MKRCFYAVALLAACLLAAVQPAQAEEFKSPKDCVAGRRVVDGLGRSGTVLDMHDQTMCKVKFDKAGTENLIFWMLHPEGQSRETNDKLVVGVYECFASGRYTFMDMEILSANTYESAGKTGRFHVEPSRKIVFETGPLVGYHSKLLAGPTIGLNANGDSFYATTCEYRKGKK